MWIPKWQRDRDRGVDSPVPTQVVSNEEFIPRPQNDEQKQVERLIGEMAEENSKKLGMDRRAYLASSMGMADRVPGPEHGLRQLLGRGPEARRSSRRRRRRSGPRASTSSSTCRRTSPTALPLGFRNAEFVRNMGFKLKERRRRLRVPELRQGDVLRQRDEHARDLRRAGQGDHARRQGQGAGRGGPHAGHRGARSCRAG